jgi:flagellin-like protein
MKRKKAQSQIIGTILLILLVVIAAGIIMAFLLPKIPDWLSGSKCLDVADKIKIRNNPQYSCYNATSTNTYVQAGIGDILDKIEGFAIELGGAASKTYHIKNSASPQEVEMYPENSPNPVQLPGNNEERTYVLKGFGQKPDYIRIYPILKDGKLCDSSDTLTTVKQCFIPFY